MIQYDAASFNTGYRGLYFNSTNSLLYVAPYFSALQEIHVFNSNLTFNHSFSISPFVFPHAITEFNNQMYEGTILNNIYLKI